ncbi:TonB-dependent receptor [Halocella sp. SP3-1]|uniref:TonB-dependent receptor plug domain-containing protein n=1 Tax=Halocella sp. SP3-1 TaxID=2382161 RepID=UPI000F74D813|nr:TonB-dependent receptor [Halocella sp. SP3-1]AZO95938.1 TonB-dependent receptor [Halocella sp. SP3-1]
MFRNHKRILGLVFLFLLLINFTIPIKATNQEVNSDEEKDLGEIVVTTSTKTEKKISEVPLIVEVITAEELKESNAKTVMEALNFINGVKAIQDSGSWGNNGVQLRGMGSKYTLVLVDGQRFRGGHNCVDLSTISIDMVQQIEIVKGPFSSLYGSDAMGGVINIITKKTPKKNYANLSAEAGSNNTRNTNLSGGFNKNEIGGNFSFTRQSSDGIKKEDRYNKDILNASFALDFTPQAKFEFSPYYSRLEHEYDDRVQERHGLNMKWKFEPDVFSNFYIRSSLLNYKHWTTDEGTNYKEDSTELELGYNRLLGTRHLFTIGGEYSLEERDDKGKDYEESQNIKSIFIQDEMDFTLLQVVLGTRIDSHELWGTEVCPNLGASYQINELMRVRGSVGKAFKAPTLVNLYADEWRMGPYLVHANADLEPEESLGYQLGLDYDFTKNATLSTTLFRNDVDNLVSSRIERNGYPYDMYWENVEEALIQGAEINCRIRLNENVSGTLGYTFLDTENKETGKELTDRSRDSLSFKFDWKTPYELDVQFSSIYKGESYSDDENENKVKDYSLLNVAFNKRISDNYEMYFNVDNLLDIDDIDNEPEIDGIEYYLGMVVKL